MELKSKDIYLQYFSSNLPAISQDNTVYTELKIEGKSKTNESKEKIFEKEKKTSFYTKILKYLVYLILIVIGICIGKHIIAKMNSQYYK